MVLGLSIAAMPYRHQQKHFPDEHGCAGQMAEYQSRASEATNESFDPALFALATALPMSCFPIDNVHLSKRYGVLEQKRNRARNNTYHGSTFCGGMTPFPLDISTRGPCRRRMNDEYSFDSMPPLSASTVSSGWTSSWSSNEHITDLGIPGPFEALSRSDSDGHFGLSESYPTAPCNAEMLAGNLADVAHDQSEYAWNGLASCDAGTVLPQQFVQPVEGQMVAYDPISSAPPTNHSAAIPQAGNALLPAPGLLPASSLPQHHTIIPPFRSRMTPEHSPGYVDQEVVDFLDELAGVINWNDVELRRKLPDTDHTRTADSQRTTDCVGAPVLGHSQHQHQQPDSHVLSSSPGLWRLELQAASAEFAPSFAEFFDASPHDYRLRSPSPFRL
jgi:hypothetical protein